MAQGLTVLVVVHGAPPHGCVMAKADFSAIVQRKAIGSLTLGNFRAQLSDGRSVPVQFVPDDGRAVAGWLFLRLPGGGDWTVRLQMESGVGNGEQGEQKGVVHTKHFVVGHDEKRMGGLPSRIVFAETGKAFGTFVWNDRVHHQDLGSFHLRNDPEPKVRVLSQGEIATVVQVRARYCQPGGKQPLSQPEAVYEWVYFRKLPLVFVMATVRQRESFAWHEVHFLELNFPDTSFGEWAGGEPWRQGKFEASQKSFGFPDWGALIDGRNAIAFLRAGQVLFHDGRGGYGTYLHAHGDTTWQGWRTTERQFSAWLFLGRADDPIAEIRRWQHRLPTDAEVTVTLPEVRSAVAKAKGWHRVMAKRLEKWGQFDEAVQVAQGKMPDKWLVVTAGDLGIALSSSDGGVQMHSLFDRRANRELLSDQPLPLFTLTLRHLPTRREVRLIADSGWGYGGIKRKGGDVTLLWERPLALSPANFQVTLQLSPQTNALLWSLSVGHLPPDWSLLRVTFPQLAIADLGENGEVFFPRGPGEVQRNLWRRSFNYRSLYPNGWATMQFVAAYREIGDRGLGTGIYVGIHDPSGSAKDLVVRSELENRQVILAFEHPVPNMGVGGNRFALSGKVVWQLLRGDWFDAAMIYRQWVRQEAKWFPKLGKAGRDDTPQWFKELCVWALGGGAPDECVPIVKEFAKFMGVPVGFHWYNWHRIPFDNDYPHYFPPKDGFADGVRTLQQSGVFVMPYINGRLWDTRDRGNEDWLFSKVALPAATKGEDGRPYTESYGSKEADGSDVQLAPMCPTTQLWQDKVREIVLRLFNEFGVNAVYIDQVAAASPALCFDKAHGHPIGGGSWWNEGYWQMLSDIRKAMPKERALTTECNAEPFVKWFDGYLTWHWQHDGQVPAFPAVYGGTIQMFGRAYRGGPTKDLALRMKAGQQLVFGEQIGWIFPDIIREKENAEFLRQVVRLRWQLRRYFYAGEMARPPRLWGNIPKVRADWQWWAEDWWVETDALLTGAWRLPQEGKLALLFVNVSDQPVTVTIAFDGRPYGFRRPKVVLTLIGAEGKRSSETCALTFHRPLSLPPKTALAWEIVAR